MHVKYLLAYDVAFYPSFFPTKELILSDIRPEVFINTGLNHCNLYLFLKDMFWESAPNGDTSPKVEPHRDQCFCLNQFLSSPNWNLISYSLC